jgi:hypothetical protein
MIPHGKGRDAGRAAGADKVGERSGAVKSGPGGLCAEAQGDGVPCTELGRVCETCRRAVQDASAPHPEGWRDPLGS